jgi:hypothetical protein
MCGEGAQAASPDDRMILRSKIMCGVEDPRFGKCFFLTKKARQIGTGA